MITKRRLIRPISIGNEGVTSGGHQKLCKKEVPEKRRLIRPSFFSNYIL